MLFPDLGDALLPLRERHPGQRGLMACQPFPRQQTWLQRASRQLQGQGGREEKTLRCLLSPRVHIVCAMMCDGDPTNLHPSNHHCLTLVHTSKRLPQWLCPMQPRYIGHTASLTASAEGDKSLIWSYRISRTPGCSTPKVDHQHSLG